MVILLSVFLCGIDCAVSACGGECNRVCLSVSVLAEILIQVLTQHSIAEFITFVGFPLLFYLKQFVLVVNIFWQFLQLQQAGQVIRVYF